MELSDIHVRIFAIGAIGTMETALICTGEDGMLLLPVAGIIGFLAGANLSEIKELVKR